MTFSCCKSRVAVKWCGGTNQPVAIFWGKGLSSDIREHVVSHSRMTSGGYFFDMSIVLLYTLYSGDSMTKNIPFESGCFSIPPL